MRIEYELLNIICNTSVDLLNLIYNQYRDVLFN